MLSTVAIFEDDALTVDSSANRGDHLSHKELGSVSLRGIPDWPLREIPDDLSVTDVPAESDDPRVILANGTELVSVVQVLFPTVSDLCIGHHDNAVALGNSCGNYGHSNPLS